MSDQVAAALPPPDGHPIGGEPPDFRDGRARKIWDEARHAREVEISIVEDEGFSRTFDSIDDLAAIPPADLSTIKSVKVVAGRYGGPCYGTIRVGGYPDALEVRIKGMDRTWVAGVRQQLQAILGPRFPLRPPILTSMERAMAAAAALVSLAAVAFVIYLRRVADLDKQDALSAGYLAALLVGALPLGAIAGLPRFELLREDQAPSYVRRRGKIGSAIAAVLIGVISGLILLPFA